MFGSDLDRDAAVNLRRRAFLGASAAAVAGVAAWSLWKSPLIAAAPAGSDAGSKESEVTIVQFSDAGKRLQKVRVPKVVKSDAEWRDAVAFAEENDLPFSDAVCEALDLVLERWCSVVIVADALKAEEVLSETRLEELRVRCAAGPERLRGRRWASHPLKGGNR